MPGMGLSKSIQNSEVYMNGDTVTASPSRNLFADLLFDDRLCIYPTGQEADTHTPSPVRGTPATRSAQKPPFSPKHLVLHGLMMSKPEVALRLQPSWAVNLENNTTLIS